ncbi:DNA polymerase III subunit alpha [bacterium]|nr:DNA polymerase III subunit alpha [bacterium]
MSQFIHLHNHTHYSLLDGACRIKDLVKQAKKFNMPAVAITDHGNMFGAIHFYTQMMKEGIKPIIGMEAYIAPRSRFEKKSQKGGHDAAYHLILLARNLKGYQNLMHLSSMAYLEGFYYKPRIDKELLENHADGVLAMSSCIKGEVPYKLIHDDYEGAREAASFYRDLFQDHYYFEIQDHGLPEEMKAKQGLIALGREMGIPVVATNDTHYLKQEHAEAHDILLCIQTNKDFGDPNRLRFTSDQIYFKSPDEMKTLFQDVPEAISNTLEVSEKCHLLLDSDRLYLPVFHVPESQKNMSLDAYFEEKVWEGASKRFSEVTAQIRDRLTHEIGVIKHMGFPGYFLIVMDFIQEAKNQGIPVGPGRGSAAGSLVSYCLEITNVNPLEYSLLFERFLNPERVSMPDIDIDFCYEQREKVIDYVKNKYGENNVTQIITFGSMNARAVIRDVGRVLKIPLSDVDRIAKLIPPNTKLKDALDKVSEFRELCEQTPANKQLLNNALVLEGLARHASTHAAGVVIAPGELTQYVPLFRSTRRDDAGDNSEGVDITTQYDMKSLGKAGLLKMDFLGLRTLTVIDHTIKSLRSRNIDISIDQLPLDDPDTYAVFANGETIGIFQFESSGMREYLRKLKPESIDDLIAMNALYRPGPMDWIDDFIDRKLERTKVEYLHPLMEPVLNETHGIIVYQEQVMQIASALGGFSLGEADLLRRAMGKKDPVLMQEQRIKFVSGAEGKGINAELANEIFDVMDKFAGYGFNKSHATCYSIVAYQTAFLKAHYPAEFMAANLTSEMGNTDRIVVLVEDCRRMGIPILPPDINESRCEFVAQPEGIRFGLGAVKNVGAGAIASMIESRSEEGKFTSIFDLCERINLRQVNKKVIESLIQVGAMDQFGANRPQLMAVMSKAVSMAQMAQQDAIRGQTSIFGEALPNEEAYPEMPDLQPWPMSEKLKREKELMGMYVSGHPLDPFRKELEAYACPWIGGLQEFQAATQVRFGGIITEVRQLLDRKNNPMAFFSLEDFSGVARLIAFSDVFEKYRDYIQTDRMIFIKGKLDRRENRDEPTIIVNEIIPIEEADMQFARRMILKIHQTALNNGEIDRVRFLLSKYPGECQLVMYLYQGEDEVVRVRSKKFKINPNPELIFDLKTVLGRENVNLEG